MSMRDLSGTAWIHSPLVGSTTTGAPAPYMRRAFSLGGAVTEATLTITALGLHDCEINGQAVSGDVLSPGWTSYHHRVNVQTFDVAALLNTGENVIGVILGDGWYCGHVGGRQRETYGRRPAY